MPGVGEEPEMTGGGEADAAPDAAAEDCAEPQPGESFMRIVSMQGTDSVEVEDCSQRRAKCALAPDLEDTAGVIIGCFVLVKETEGVKSAAAVDEPAGTIVKIYSKDQVRVLRETTFWPSAFGGPAEELCRPSTSGGPSEESWSPSIFGGPSEESCGPSAVGTSEESCNGVESPSPVEDPDISVEDKGDCDEPHDTANHDQANHDQVNHDQANHEEANHDQANHEEATHDETNHDQANHDQANHGQANNVWKGSNGVLDSRAGAAEAGKNSGWETVETSRSILGPGPTDEGKPTEQKSTAPKEIHTFFMIRIPRPVDSKTGPELRKAEMVFRETSEKRDFITAALNMKKAGRNEVIQKIRAAREKKRVSGDALQQKRAEIEPLQEVLFKLKDAGRLARDKSRDLPSSEQELDELIAYKEYRIQHESIPLKEEKLLLREIKVLNKSRDDVRHFERLQTEFSGSKDEREQMTDRLKPLVFDLDSLKADYAAALESISAAESELEEIDAERDKLQSQLTAAKQAAQDAYEHRASLIREENARNDEFYRNKKEINAVKQLAFKREKKAVEELCNAQDRRVMGMWNSSGEFRAAYLKNNERSTLKRLQTFDGRALGPDEEPPLLSGERDGPRDEPRIEPEQAALTLNSSKKESMKESADDNRVPGSTSSDIPRKNRDPESNPFASSNGRLSSMEAIPVSDGPVSLDKDDERAEEEGRIAAAKLKEKRREQEMAKAKEASERKRRSAERSQSKALARAQKDAERREKEKEKKAQKKAAASLLSSSQGASAAAEKGSGEAAESIPGANHVQESPPPEVRPSGRQRRRAAPQKLKTLKTPALPVALSKKDSSRLPYWYWIGAGVVGVIMFLALLPRFVL